MKRSYRKFFCVLAVLAIGAFGGACGESNPDGKNGAGNNGANNNGAGNNDAGNNDAGNNEDGNNGGAGPMQISGQLTDYDHGEVEFSAGRGLDDVATGTVNPDGSFTATFFGEDEIGEYLLPIDPDAEEHFSAYPCQSFDSDPVEISDTDARLVAATQFKYSVMVDGNPEPWAITLTDQTEGDINIIVPLPQGTEKRVFWIYSDRPVQITGECTYNTGSEWPGSVELDLNTGWNEVVRDFDDHQRHHMWTGDRPEEVDWYHAPY